MLNITQQFMIDIDTLYNKINKRYEEEEEKDDDYFIVFLCQEIGNKYIKDNDGDIFKTIETLKEVYENTDKNTILLKYISALCIYVIKLRVGKQIKDDDVINDSLQNMNLFIKLIDNFVDE